ncbi:hypothetical protein ACIRPX_42985 [Streptomyces sp. NPDC101225]|uniref:hypothetical protein n=1 Tax=Streptomyces sp. NPDC101225 TaxID=3366135 RepID=UPI003830000D
MLDIDADLAGGGVALDRIVGVGNTGQRETAGHPGSSSRAFVSGPGINCVRAQAFHQAQHRRLVVGATM